MTDETPQTEMKIERPSLTFQLDEDREIKMSYGLEMDIRRMLPDPQSAMVLLMSDPFTQDYLTRRVLTPKKMMILDEKDLIPQEEVDIDSDTIERLLMWVTEHCLYFFMKRASSMGEMGVRFNQALPNLSTNGSPVSPSTTESAGPLVSSKAN